MGTNLDLTDPDQIGPLTGSSAQKPALTTTPADASTPDDRARQGDDSRPFCEKHQCLMKANGTGPDVTYYACPVPGCGCKQKKIRPQFKMSADPHVCPQETCREPVQYLEAKERQPLVAVVVMRCPKCGFEIQQPRAQFRPRQYGNKDELGAR